MKEIFEVKLINTKNNFLHFNDAVIKKLSSSQTLNAKPILKLSVDNSPSGAFTSSPAHSLADWEVGISSVLAKSLNLEEGQTVSIATVDSSLPVARSVTVSPATEEDYEILELNSHNIQEHALDQLQAVAVGQPIVVWATPHLHINLIVDCVDPSSEMVLLSDATELHVSPHPPSHRKVVAKSPTTPASPVWSGVRKIYRALVGAQETDNATTQPVEPLGLETIFRVHPMPEETCNPSVIKIHSNYIPEFQCAKIEVIWSTKSETKYSYVQIEKADDLISIEPFKKNPIVYVNKSSYSDFNLVTGSKIVLKPLTSNADCDKLKFQSDSKVTAEEVRNVLLDLATNNVLLINSGTKLDVSPNTRGTLELDKDFAVFTRAQLEKCSIRIVVEKSEDNKTDVEETCDISLPALHDNLWQDLFAELMFSVRTSLASGPRSVVVVRGPPGSGKSSLCRLLQDQLAAPPGHTHWATVDCRLLKGKQVDNVRTHFLKIFQECVRLQPSVALVENLEVFCPLPSLEQRETPEASYSLSVQELIWNMAVTCGELHNVVLVATTSNNDAFHWPEDITPVEYFSMPELTLEDKREMLSHFLNSQDTVCDKGLINKLVKITEGYRIQDLKDLADRIIFNIWKRIGPSELAPVVVERGDVVSALADFVPLGMRGVKLFSARGPPPELGGEEDDLVEVKWANVGGLHDIKQNLTELIEWPSKYPQLFSAAPLKLQMGVVLYGVPGSGKTLLAAELARTSGANFISVKGPELLSKYIGASEQAVRDIFDKANSAKPCILFFDEFDSLAPSRGRDTTGVSDRVVNQLLTSLDGVDSPTDSGVWVVAATSRPDLLDKALLRPGRLDTILQCPLPDQEERLDILRILSRKLSTSEDVDLTEVADKTAGFSGADLQAVLYSAQLAALEESLGDFQLESLDGEELPSGDVTIRVSQGHVRNALAATRPSLSRAELARYEKIYNDFEKARTPGESKNFIPAQRAMLA